MPTRIIRESMLDSHRYASLGDPAKLLFVHMLLLADDFGCITITPTFLRRRAFYNAPTNEHIAKLLGELSDADLVRPYQHDGGDYAFIPRFRQRLQRTTLRHPSPPQSLLHGDDDATHKFNKINGVTEKSTVVKPLSTVGQPPEVEVEVEVEVKKKGTPVVKKGSTHPPGAFVRPKDCDTKVWDDWLLVRKRKRLPNTDTAWAATVREATIAGLTPAQAVTVSAERGWGGFKAEWIAGSGGNGSREPKQSATMRAIGVLDAMMAHPDGQPRHPDHPPQERLINDDFPDFDTPSTKP